MGEGGTWKMQRSSSSLFCSTLWYSPSSISSADQGIANPPRCPKECFWSCCDTWHVRTVQVSVSWQLPEGVPVDPQGSWSCSAPSHWSWLNERVLGFSAWKKKASSVMEVVHISWKNEEWKQTKQGTRMERKKNHEEISQTLKKQKGSDCWRAEFQGKMFCYYFWERCVFRLCVCVKSH